MKLVRRRKTKGRKRQEILRRAKHCFVLKSFVSCGSQYFLPFFPLFFSAKPISFEMSKNASVAFSCCWCTLSPTPRLVLGSDHIFYLY